MCFVVLAVTLLAFVFLLTVRHTSSRPAQPMPVPEQK
jgi:hypothetical protein